MCTSTSTHTAVRYHSPADFIGAETTYRLADGRITRRHYLDAAATTLALRSAYETGQQLLPHVANIHSTAHFSARLMQQAFDHAHEQVRLAVGGTKDHVVIFAGSGCTALLNRWARTLVAYQPDRDIVLVSLLEHHANDLPHRRHAQRVVSLPLMGRAPALGTVDIDALSKLLRQYGRRVKYIALSAASNVTGICQPIAEVVALAHTVGALVLVDAAQSIAHMPFSLQDSGADAVVFSGHKVYAPGSPGVAVVQRSLLTQLAPDEWGGGMVETVSEHDYQARTDWPAREEAGTPNLIGAVQLGAALAALQQMGMDALHVAEQTLLVELLEGLAHIPDIRLYGPHDPARIPQVGVVAFNVGDIPHGLLAAILNDYHNVAVRNGCFCAQPYVRALLQPELWALDADPDTSEGLATVRSRQGMVRVSLGLYNSEEDIAALLAGVEDARRHVDRYRVQYTMDAWGTFHHCRP